MERVPSRPPSPGDPVAPYSCDDIAAIFTRVVEADATRRPQLLAELCGGRTVLRAEVEALLDAHERPEALVAPVSLQAVLEAHDRPIATSPTGHLDVTQSGDRVGPFRLLERIGQGGMGDVYRAERVDGDFTQQVAIKLLGARLLGTAAIERFRQERQILASLEHPHIVRFLDGGVTTDGQPYIVMAFVEGVAITDYCRSRDLTLEPRLRLFQQLISAVSWAHRHLIVHRDLKPANVLVSSDGVVHVVDFGVAKLLTPGLSAMTASHGAPMTPNYASPEQIAGKPATTTCDVYSLGVMLFEMVAGVRPYETEGQTLDELRRLLLERSADRPSAATSPQVPYDVRRLRGDVDTIVAKAMAPDPRDRYAAAEELGDDIARLLDGLPVAAREPSLAYVLRKTVGRHRAVFAVATVALGLLVTALAGAVWQGRIAAAERERALQRFNDVRELAGALIFQIHDQVAPLAGSTPVRQTIVAQGLEFLGRLERDAGSDDQLLAELAAAYIRMGHVQGRTGEANLGDHEGALRSYRRAWELIRPVAARQSDVWEVIVTAVEVELALAGNAPGDERRAASAAALARAAGWHAREPHTTRSRELLARAHFQSALVLGPPASLPHWQQVQRLFSAVLAEKPTDSERLRNAALGLKYLGSYYEAEGQLEPALDHYRRALGLDQQRMAAAPDDRQAQLDYAIDIGNIANVQLQRGEHEAAIEAFTRSLEVRQRIAHGDPKDMHAQSRVAFVHTKLATLYVRTGRVATAREHARRAATLLDPLTGAADAYRSQQFMALRTLGDVERNAGRGAAACQAYRTAHRVGPGQPINVPLEETIRHVDRAVAECDRASSGVDLLAPRRQRGARPMFNP